MKYFKQYGEQRTGTNYLKSLLEINFKGVTVFASVLGWKHGMYETGNHKERWYMHKDKSFPEFECDSHKEWVKKIGSSCDWDRTKFTLDKQMYESVIKVFVDLYDKGLIYKGYRMVNWDPEAKTTLSDEEVVYEERNGRLYYVLYSIWNMIITGGPSS